MRVFVIHISVAVFIYDFVGAARPRDKVKGTQSLDASNGAVQLNGSKGISSPIALKRNQDIADAEEVNQPLGTSKDAVARASNNKDVVGQQIDSAADESSNYAMAQREDLNTNWRSVRQQDVGSSLGRRDSPKDAFLDLTATGFPVRSTQSLLVSTFVVPGISRADLRTGGEVFIDMSRTLAEDQAALAEGTLAELARTLQVTASVFVGDREVTIATGSGYPVRWFASSGAEYVVCGHGNLATGFLMAQNGVSAGDGYPLVQAYAYSEEYAVKILEKRGTEVKVEVNMGTVEFYQSRMMTIESDDTLLAGLVKLFGCDPANIIRGPSKLFSFVGFEDEKFAMVLIFFVNKLSLLQTPRETLVARSQKPYRGLLAVEVKKSLDKFNYRGFYPELKLPEDKATGSANVFITIALTSAFGINKQFQSMQWGPTIAGTGGSIQSIPGGTKPTGQFSSRTDAANVYVTGWVQLLPDGRLSAEYREHGGVAIYQGCKDNGGTPCDADRRDAECCGYLMWHSGTSYTCAHLTSEGYDCHGSCGCVSPVANVPDWE